MRKGGAGKGNWGTMKDDLKQDPTENREQADLEIEEKDDSLTLSELLGIKNKRQIEKPNKQQNQQKDIDLSGFKKDKCELVQKKKDIDDNKTGSKKTIKTNEMHNIMGSNDNKELLGLRTGLQAYSEKPRIEGKNEQPERRPKESREQRE